MTKLELDIWSDIACPWCYIGKRHLEEALAAFEHAADVEIRWRAFELDPSAPRVRDTSQTYVERLAAKYRVPVAQGQQMIDRVIETGARAGIAFRYDIIRPGNTFDAHRLLHWADEQGRQGDLKERLLHAYLTEGAAIGEPGVLAALAADIGLDAAEAREVLAGERYAREVRADEALARELGISGVPFFVMAGRIGVSGAQPAEVLRGALAQAWADHVEPERASAAGAAGAASPAAPASDDDPAACGPDGCDVPPASSAGLPPPARAPAGAN